MRSAARLEPLALLLAVGFLLAVNVNLSKAGALAGLGAVELAFAMNLGAGGILLLAALGLRRPLPFSRRVLLNYLVSGAVSFALPAALGFAVAARVGPAYGAIIYAFSPLITFGLALGVGLERFRAWRGIGLVGTAIVVAARLGISAEGEAAWVLAGLLIPLSVALGNVVRTLLWPEGVSPLSLAPGMLLTAAAMLAPGRSI